MAVADLALDAPARPLAPSRWLSRLPAWGVILTVALAVPLALEQTDSQRWSLAVIYAIVALSLNVLIGYAGQISLGHQGFLGVGAFTSAYVVTSLGQPFLAGVLAGVLVGALASLLMGVVALRVRGLYLALVTLSYGAMAEEALFNLSIFGAGSGIQATRPSFLVTDRAFYYACVAALVLVLYLDWRFTRSMAGRAVQALRENEQVASSYGIPVARFKLLAFVLAGGFVGLAGALFAFRTQTVSGIDFRFTLALQFVIITVVGGLRSRWGVVVWALVFTLLPDYLSGGSADPFASRLGLVIGAVLLVLILVFRPGGIGQLIRPVTNWLTGGPFKGDEDGAVEEGVRGRP
jgi:branched-chain amino acid transport system permease protein